MDGSSGVKLGDYQFERAAAWAERGQLALVGIDIEPGAADVLARYTADHLFAEIDEVGIRDGANLVVEGYDFAPIRLAGGRLADRDQPGRRARAPGEGGLERKRRARPEVFDPLPFLELLREYGSPHGVLELQP